jgi:endo-1,4-beta-xylanase
MAVMIGGLMLFASEPAMSQNSLPDEPLSAGLQKWLGCAHSGLQVENHELYWSQVTPENGGKWGEVERARDRMDWDRLDDAYNHAKTYGMPFRYHVLVWGQQQPGWIAGLSESEQLTEIEEWFDAVAARYPEIDYLEVVNEPLHAPPSYKAALGGDGDTGWDWVITAFEMARARFPDSTKLMINDYGMLNDPSTAGRYRQLIELLQERDLIDGIGVQGHAFNTRAGQFNGRVVLNLLGSTGLPIQVTEMDVDGNPTSDPALSEEKSDENQLEDIQRIFPVLWEHDAVEGITLWGWRPGLWRQSQEAYLVRENGSERPAMQWLREYMEEYRSIALASEPEFTVPRDARLVGSYPNPFNGSTQIRYQLSSPGRVTLTVHDMFGREVATLVDRRQAAGDFTVTFDAGNSASGVYFYRLTIDSYVETIRGLLVK